MKTKLFLLTLALLALHVGARAQQDTAVVATAPAPVIPAGEKADSVQRAASENMHPGFIGPNARSKANAERECPAACEAGRIGSGGKK